MISFAHSNVETMTTSLLQPFGTISNTDLTSA